MNAKRYVNEILSRSCLPYSERQRLKNDLMNEVEDAITRGETIEQVMERMGDPDDIARELYENFTGTEDARLFREYKSELTIFGLPLVHIVRPVYGMGFSNVRGVSFAGVRVGTRYGVMSFNGIPTARGIFALGVKARGVFTMGIFSFGLISIGIISCGLITLGNVSFGLFSLGNLAVSALAGIGNFAVGLVSAGNLSAGYASAGNLALGKFAIGNEVAGEITFKVTKLFEQMGDLQRFFAGLDAPAFVKAFFNQVESTLLLFTDPPRAIVKILLCVLALIAVVLIPLMLSWALLKRKENQNFYDNCTKE